MNKLIKKNLTVSNIIFVLAVAILLYPPSREWFMRQIAFSPSINKVEEADKVTNYNWNLKGLNADNINFNELEEKVVFINFWATWCPPCRAEMPMIQELYDDYKDKVDFYFVSNEKVEILNEFLTKNNYSFKVHIPKTKYPEMFDVSGIPRTFLIDKKGNIVINKTGAANWNSDKVRNQIDELLLN